jgi:hypothetical protein
VYRFSLFLFTLLLFAAAPLVTAQEAGIAYGDTARGEITDAQTQYAVFMFEGSAGDTVTITVTSDDTDTVVELTDTDGNTLAENDDISDDNLNSQIEFTLEDDGMYAINVYVYEAGTFEVSLESDSVSNDGSSNLESGPAEGISGENFTGTIDDDNPYVKYILPLEEGQDVTIAASATSGDLDTYLILLDSSGEAVAENDDVSQTSTDSVVEYAVDTSDDYTLVITRYDFENGKTSGDFELSFDAVSGGSEGTSSGAVADFDDSSSTTSGETAKWTILAYIGGDNNLEESAVIDLDEFELAGGSTSDVRTVVFLDRSPEYDNSNGDWTSARVFEVGGDSGQVDGYLPVIDTQELFDLGGVNSGSGETLEAFLLWGIENYPAENYVIVVNDHGGGWTGLVSDETEGGNLSITPPEYQQVFANVAEAAGVERFALLINDACLMSSIEYLDVVAPYFDYSLGASEIMNGPGYDMTMLTLGLQQDASIEEIGTALIDRYMETMAQYGLDSTQAPTLIDMQGVPAVTEAIENFAALYNQNPAYYADIVGQARYNTYAYGLDTWLNFLIDAGDLMNQVIYFSDDPDLTAAAEYALATMEAAVVYKQRGTSVPETTTQFNINFPLSANEYIGDYVNNTPLYNWNDLLSNYYGGYTSRARTAAPPSQVAQEPTLEPTAALIQPTLPPSEDVVPVSKPPKVTITSVYPEGEISVNNQAIVSMEVVGRNVARGTFTVDEVMPEGSVRRVDTTDILTFVEVEPDVFEYIHQWDAGVNDFDFYWTPTLTTVTDGVTTEIELVVTQDDQAFMSGRYRANADDGWVDVRLMFSDDGVASRAISVGENGQGLAGSITIREGGEFQAYNARVTPDGQIVYEPGNTYTVPAEGLQLGFTNAPSGEYQLGFLIEALGGVTGFNSTGVTVNNDDIDPNLQGYTSLADGFTLQYPAEWTAMEFFADREYFSTSDADGVQQIYVYPITDATDLDSTLQGFVDAYVNSLDSDPTPITVAGSDGLEFTFTGGDGENAYTGKAFAVFNEATSSGLVFSAERTDSGDPDEIYQTLLANVSLFDGASVQAVGAGEWDWDLYTDETYYPVPTSWMPGAEGDFGWIYSVPDVEGAFAGVAVFPADGSDAATLLEDLLFTVAPDYVLDSVETYYGENHTWEVASYTKDGVVGRLYLTVENDMGYGVWFEAPADSAETLFADYFEPMLDGFKITPVE